MRYPFTGFWREAINPTDVSEIDETETEKHFAGEVKFWYDTATSKQIRGSSIEGLSKNEYEYVLQTKDDIPFKPGDEIILYDGNKFGVIEVSDYVPEKYKRLVGSNPNLRHRYKVKLLVLR